MSWLITFTMWLLQSWFDGCNIAACFRDVYPHVCQHFGGMSGYGFAKNSTEYVVRALKSMGEYQAANALVHLGIELGVAIRLVADMLWRIHKRRVQTNLTLDASYNLVTDGTNSLS